MMRAPSDFSNMTGMIAKMMRDYVDQRGGFSAFDKSDLGFKAKWSHVSSIRPEEAQWRVSPLEGVPAGIQTPLVSVIRVVDWRTYTETEGKSTVDVAHVQLIMSTWTKEGKEVLTEQVDVLARAGSRMTTHSSRACKRRCAGPTTKRSGCGWTWRPKTPRPTARFTMRR